MSIIAVIDDRNQWSDGHKIHAAGYLTFAGSYVANGVTVDLGAAGFRSGAVPLWFEVSPYMGLTFHYVPGTTAADGKLIVRGDGSSSVQATGTLTSDNTNVADGATVTIGSQVYTFKTALSSTHAANEVLIGASADDSLLNLIRAINGTGTAGTDYGSDTVANTDVTAASSVTSHAFAVTARRGGTDGNLIATTETSSHLSWGGATLSSGAASTVSGAQLAASAFPTELSAGQVPFYVIADQSV